MSELETILQLSSGLSFLALAMAASAQRLPYGPEITLDLAKKIAAAAIAEAGKNSWNVAVAIVDNHGFLVYYERLDDTQTASPTIAVEKARSAAMFRRATREMQDGVNKGNPAFLGIPGATPIAGGLPITVGGKIIGGVGVSGVTSDQDEQIAKAGLEAVK